MITNAWELNQLITVRNADGSPYGFIGKTLELWVKPYAGAGVPAVIKASTSNGMLTVIDDANVQLTIPTATMQTLVARKYVLDFLDILARTPVPRYFAIFSGEMNVQQAITEAQ